MLIFFFFLLFVVVGWLLKTDLRILSIYISIPLCVNKYLCVLLCVFVCFFLKKTESVC